MLEHCEICQDTLELFQPVKYSNIQQTVQLKNKHLKKFFK
jgi:hypothetical protein